MTTAQIDKLKIFDEVFVKLAGNYYGGIFCGYDWLENKYIVEVKYRICNHMYMPFSLKSNELVTELYSQEEIESIIGYKLP